MLKLFVFLLATVAVYQVASESSVTKQKLVKELMKDYLKEVDPGETDLTLSLSYLCADLSRYTHELTSKLLESYAWVDSRLQWDASKYEGIKQIRLPAKMIWNPDFKLYNAPKESEARDDVNVIVYANGSVIWIPTVTYKSYCEPAKENEDADSLFCKLKIGSWTYDADTLKLRTTEQGVDTFMYIDACPYVLTDPKVRVESKIYPCCPEKYSSLEVTFGIHHRL